MKGNVLYLAYVLLGLKKENCVVYKNVHGLPGHYSNLNKTEKDKNCMISLTSGI